MAGTNTVRFAFTFCPAVVTTTQGEGVPIGCICAMRQQFIVLSPLCDIISPWPSSYSE